LANDTARATTAVRAVRPLCGLHVRLKDRGFYSHWEWLALCETLAELPDETWATSVSQWMGTHWEVLVDLWTVESGKSDLVLDARVFEQETGFRIEIHSVYVP